MNNEETSQCSICGKEFDFWDKQQNFTIGVYGQYGSKHDTEHIKCKLCCDCMDNLLDDYLLPRCIHNPIVDTDGGI